MKTFNILKKSIGGFFILKRNNNLDYVIDDFMIYCQQKDLRPKTIASYEATLRLFSRYLQDNCNIVNVKDITEKLCKEYITFTKERGKYTFIQDNNTAFINHPTRREDYNKKISITTVNNYLRNMKVFFSYCVEARIIKENPMSKMRQLKNNRKPKGQITDQEFKRLLQNMDTTKFHEFRDYVIIQLIFDTGMRIGETLSLNIKDVDIERRAISIPQEITKGRKERYVFFSLTMQRLLRRWLQYKDRYTESDLLFCTKRNTRLSISNLEKNFKGYCRRIGLDNITLHGLRNNYARRFLLAGGDIFTLSKLLGHSSVTVTEQAYLDLSDSDIRQNYQKFSPLENMKR